MTTPETSSASNAAEDAKPDLPLGTQPEYARMHKFIRRVCYVLLFGLVIEGALTFPLLAIWYGFPKLSPTEVCSELQKEMYADDARECEVPYKVFPGPPIGGPSEAEGQTTAEDMWGVQPQPGNDRIDFRELVENKEERERSAGAGAEEDPDRTTSTTVPSG